MEIQASLILQTESILSNKKANDGCENYSNTLWNLHEHFRVRSDTIQNVFDFAHATFHR